MRTGVSENGRFFGMAHRDQSSMYKRKPGRIPRLPSYLFLIGSFLKKRSESSAKMGRSAHDRTPPDLLQYKWRDTQILSGRGRVWKENTAWPHGRTAAPGTESPLKEETEHEEKIVLILDLAE